MRAIQELAGHQDLTMTQRYMHLSPAALDATPSGCWNTQARSDRAWRNSGDGEGLKKVEVLEQVNWLGGRDSNPDNMLQRHASYRWTTSQYRPTRPEG